MIREKDFLKYQLETERRFSQMQRTLDEYKAELSASELRHKIEIQRLLLEMKKPITPPQLTEEEQKRAKSEANVMLQYSEDPELLRKLGYNVVGYNVEGGVNE